MNRPALMKKERPQPSDRAAYFIATGAGAGLAPKAPGTLGALEAVAVYLIISALALAPLTQMILLAALSLLSLFAGIWAASRACKMCGLDDPSHVVIDEVHGQFIALVPLAPGFSIAGVVLAFVSFRLFDIFKPYPIRKLEHLHGGLGVMADDSLSGIFAALVVWLATRWLLL